MLKRKSVKQMKMTKISKEMVSLPIKIVNQ